MRQFQSQSEVDAFVNQMRIGRGLPPLPDGYHVVQIVEGLVTGCGCRVTSVVPGDHFTIYHHNDCKILYRRFRHEVVRCTPKGQAMCGTPDPYTKAVMRLDLPWPYELWGTGA